MKNLIELSREVSYALRHAPRKYGLEMDCQGWVSVEQLLNALHESEHRADVKTAKTVGKRRNQSPLILKNQCTNRLSGQNYILFWQREGLAG